MTLFDMKYGPGQFAQKSGHTPETLRDWRRRGLDIGIGVSISGQKTYCDYDLLEMYLHSQLRIAAFDSVKEAFKAARSLAPPIAKRLGYSLSGIHGSTTFGAFSRNYALASFSQPNLVFTDDVNDFMERDLMASAMKPACKLYDLVELTEMVRGWAKENLPAASAG
jgi:hypothetical protein